MVARALIVLSISLTATGCGLDPFEPTLGFDAGDAQDAGPVSMDASRPVDAGPARDAGDTVDAGMGIDASERTDAGTDAGFDGAAPDACTSFVEECNNRDDNCNERVDEDLTQPCMNACGEMGTERCSAGAYVDCTAPAVDRETCNAMDDDCDGTIDEGAGCSCPIVNFGGHAYGFCGFLGTVSMARSACRFGGYELATINDAAENAFVTAEAIARRNEEWFIGYTDEALEATWVWDHGTSTYENWGSGEPTPGSERDCTALVANFGSRPDGTWFDEHCGDRHPFVCESPEVPP